jgi:3-hydroxyisobutyrate dehydrogenase-like beta-hydroxyacid dehydrogenase
MYVNDTFKHLTVGTVLAANTSETAFTLAIESCVPYKRHHSSPSTSQTSSSKAKEALIADNVATVIDAPRVSDVGDSGGVENAAAQNSIKPSSSSDSSSASNVGSLDKINSPGKQAAAAPELKGGVDRVALDALFALAGGNSMEVIALREVFMQVSQSVS